MKFKPIVIIILVALVAGPVMNWPKVARAANFSINDTVKVTRGKGTNVRQCASTGCSEITDIDYLQEAPKEPDGYAPHQAQGRVLAGPKNSNGYTWWQVEFISLNTSKTARENNGDRKYTGWTIENNLTRVDNVSGKIEYHIANKNIVLGENLNLELKVTNIGNSTHTFMAGATLWNPNGDITKEFTKQVSLAPSGSQTINWHYAPDQLGNWGYQFGLWRNTPFEYKNLLDLAPGYPKSKWDINVQAKPQEKSDLIIESINIQPDPPVAAGSTDIGIKIKNQGSGDAIGTFLLEFYFDGTYKGHVYIDGLNSGSSKTSYWRAQIWPADTNLHTIKGVVDPDPNIHGGASPWVNIVESDENNNEKSASFRATELPISTGTLKIESVPSGAKVYICEELGQFPCEEKYKGDTLSTDYLTISDLTSGDHFVRVVKTGYQDWKRLITIPVNNITYQVAILEKEKPDLIVANINIEPNPPIAAGYSSWKLTVKNQGNADVTDSFFLECYFDNIYIGKVEIDGLVAGASQVQTWNAKTWPADVNSHTIKGVVDPDNFITESDESQQSNELTKSFKANELPVGTGTLKIESTPGVAEVYICEEIGKNPCDNPKHQGTTPLTGYLTVDDLIAGYHFIKVTKLGYEEWTNVATVPAGSTAYEVAILIPSVTKPAPPILISPGSKSAPYQVIDTLAPPLEWQSVAGTDYYMVTINKYPYNSDDFVYKNEQVSGTPHPVPDGKLDHTQFSRSNHII